MVNQNEVNINLTEIVRQEVRAALKTMLAQGIDGAAPVVKSGDYREAKIPPANMPEATATASPKVEAALPVKVVLPDGTVQHRRRKRTQAEMRAAIDQAMPAVKQKHPDWSERRLRRLAKNLVRRYKLGDAVLS